MFNKLKNIKDLRSQAKQMQAQFADITAEADAAWGKVKVKVNGNQQMVSVNIDPEMLTDKEKLQDAIIEASNSAMKKVQKEAAIAMQKSGNFNLPGLG
ncbi:nucleoid-associated protein, YbaB/EbfC family [Candidatus Falkowbacteria bacterium CG10_big_fil_rev_8_21_14_0_10_39_11]|uniref:Nucleoid-associated protein COT97_03610 n=1 Tax=Candidatus Falkowbacteria bacterium CG10_big_fil_rev_8_21_14_0_10_39_11 TaxID=1974565 RepID=A0A2H0V4L1_9BACT|nr:MAG: nucleoid-associated protein, YbaB/EbfC family [Candidatus Falkowbacteria bacterium CG10_big_fil_rev_8_21_14_0_10_39_11]